MCVGYSRNNTYLLTYYLFNLLYLLNLLISLTYVTYLFYLLAYFT